jgi:dihydropteroate synthase
MQQNPQYHEVVAEVVEWLRLAGERAVEAGVRREQLIADPGIGFGKTTTHNLELLARLSDSRCLGYPVLIGASRKSVIGNVLQLPVDQRVEGTAATVALSVQEHAEIIRVHDVKQMRRVVDMTHAIVSAAFI